MKTTIELPDELVVQAQNVADESGTTLRELVVDGLRAEIERRAAEQAEFRFTTVGGYGLQVDIEPGRLTDLAYDLPR